MSPIARRRRALVGWIGQGQTFFVFAVVCSLGVAFVSRWVPETRQRNYLEIDAELQSRWVTAP